MANGQEIASQNVERFNQWKADKTDAHFSKIAFRGSLSRTKIHQECGFSKSVLTQNPKVRELLQDLEGALRQRGVLPPQESDADEARSRVGKGNKSSGDCLEQENALLRGQVSALKKELRQYESIRLAFELIGRVPR